jgi:RNA polymerase sigma-70 factor (ECF subfamily)
MSPASRSGREAAAGAGDAPSLAAVHSLYADRVRRHLARLVGPAEAEDLTQTVFLKAAAAWDAFQGKSSLATWIYRIAANVALDRLRGRAVRQKALPQLARLADAGEAGQGRLEPSAEQAAARNQMRDCIRSMVDTLPDEARHILILADMEGFSAVEIATILDVNPGAAKIRLHRARARLRAIMEGQCRLSRDERNVLVCDRRPGDAQA